MCMDADFKQEWYGMQAKILKQTDDCMIVDCGIEGRAMITNYFLFDGIQLCFMDMDTSEVIPSQSFHSDIIQITYCREGRYECEFSNHTVSYLPKGSFGVASTQYLPIAVSFPLKRCYAVSLVIDKRALSDATKKILESVSLDPNRIGDNLGIEDRWYVKQVPPKLEKLFEELCEVKDCEQVGYFKIKAVELLYNLDQIHQAKGCDFKYFDRWQIDTTKEILRHLEEHLDEKISLESLVKESDLSLSVFHNVFSNIYGETPYAYLKKYKMNLAAEMLLEEKRKIGEIALEVGYSNASKFAKAFESVYGVLPKDYRKTKKV